MRIYLSNYWKKNCIFSAVIVSIIIIATVMFCVWSHDREDYILIAGSLFFVFLICYMIFISMKLVRYVVKDKQQFIMYSFVGKKISSLNLETEIYYEVLPLTEGMFSKQDFIVLSNTPFMSYRSNHFICLSKICKSIDKHGNQIIMPYNKQYITNLFDISAWHKII